MMMEELTTTITTNDFEGMPSLLQYGINLPFRFAITGQTDSQIVEKLTQ